MLLNPANNLRPANAWPPPDLVERQFAPVARQENLSKANTGPSGSLGTGHKFGLDLPGLIHSDSEYATHRVRRIDNKRNSERLLCQRVALRSRTAARFSARESDQLSRSVDRLQDGLRRFPH